MYVNSICTPFANFAESTGRDVFPSSNTACVVNNVLQIIIMCPGRSTAICF